MKGCHGKILIVDLSSRRFEVEELPEEVYRRYLGGYGLGAYYIYRHIDVGCDPLGPANILGFTPGLLTGSGAAFTGRYSVCAKSPLTGKGPRSNGEYCNGGWGNANSGGTFGPAIKRTGFDAIFYRGASEVPVYLLIKEGVISIEDASSLWGLDTTETEDSLLALHGPRAAVASIGLAGENLSLIAGICNDRGRIAGRSGLGAVMGSKRLKALCLVGNAERPEYADKSTMQAITREYFGRVSKYAAAQPLKSLATSLDFAAPAMRLAKMGMSAPPEMFGRVIGATFGGAALGTTMANVISSQVADTPLKNYSGVAATDFPMRKALKLRGKRIRAFGKQQYGCHSCPLKCGYLLDYDQLPYASKETHRPEYETCATLGGLILNDDLDVVMQANEYLNRSGMDSISAGSVLAYTLEAAEKGILKKEDFVCADYPQGFFPQFGAAEYVMPLLKLLVTREGIGDKLADGVWVAQSHFPGSEESAINANGSELGMHDQRIAPGLGLAFIADPTPGRHTSGGLGLGPLISGFLPGLEDAENGEHPFQQGKAACAAIKMNQVLESLGLCQFGFYFGDYRLIDMLKAATGWEMSPAEVLEIGGRIQTARQMFNAREGAIRHEIQQRAIGSPPLAGGAAAGKSIDPETMAQGYYEGMGFRQDGVPTAETLGAYGLEYMLADLPSCTGAPRRLVNEYVCSGAAITKGSKARPVIGG